MCSRKNYYKALCCCSTRRSNLMALSLGCDWAVEMDTASPGHSCRHIDNIDILGVFVVFEPLPAFDWRFSRNWPLKMYYLIEICRIDPCLLGLQGILAGTVAFSSHLWEPTVDMSFHMCTWNRHPSSDYLLNWRLHKSCPKDTMLMLMTVLQFQNQKYFSFQFLRFPQKICWSMPIHHQIQL